MNEHDKRLLEAAVRAQVGDDLFSDYYWRKGYMSATNALENNADAFRMMLDLRIEVKVLQNGLWVQANDAVEYVGKAELGVESQSCALARATRRAIVRAAAHIGERL